MEQSQVKHELLFCARVLLGNIRRLFIKKSRILECLLLVSYSTVVLYIRNHGGLGMKIITQKPASQYLPGAFAVLVRYN